MLRIIDSEITFLDYPSAEDWALIVYIAGCSNNCSSCHNIQFKDPNPLLAGIVKIENAEQFDNYISVKTKSNFTNRVVLSGGDPLFKNNLPIIKEWLDKYVEGKYEVCIYTGHDIDYVKKNNIKGFKFIKCGKYDKTLSVESKKTDKYIQLASTNQNFYDNNYNQLGENGRFDYDR